MSNKFIPLEERMELFARIDSLRLSISDSTVVAAADARKSRIPRGVVNLLSILAAGVGVLISIIGAYSLVWRERRASAARLAETKMSIRTALDYELMVGNALRKVFPSNIVTYGVGHGLGDYLIRGETNVIVEAKYVLDKPLSRVHLDRLLGQLVDRQEGLVVVTNMAPTSSAEKSLEEFSREHSSPVALVVANDEDHVEQEIRKIPGIAAKT